MKEAYEKMMKNLERFIMKHCVTRENIEAYRESNKKEKKLFMDSIQLMDASLDYVEEVVNHQIRVEEKLDEILKRMKKLEEK